MLCAHRALRKMKSQSDSTLLAALRSVNEEKILEVDGTVTTQPVLEHAGISTWPGRSNECFILIDNLGFG